LLTSRVWLSVRLFGLVLLIARHLGWFCLELFALELFMKVFGVQRERRVGDL
jgi:hypothetical protein